MTEDLSTPLHKACAGSKPGHLSAVKQLLAVDADVHALNKWRETPLLTAANHGQAKAVEALLRAGADACKCTDTGWSPLSIAAYKGHDDVVRLLLEEGAPTEEDDPTLSALLQAATKGLPDTVELLLRHGADHTVTTKKGDTALSILVEQQLIDAAVEMVTEYKASIARCSRDRKKVQRARLLINLRIKQQQRDGLLRLDSDEDETDEESNDSNSALHEQGTLALAASPPSSKKKKKKKSKGSKESAEAQARAAEEALLLELEQEETQAQKHEAAVNSKRAKKKKKRERERQQKLKEEQERREREEKEAQEKERLQKMKEEKERKARQLMEKERREREAEEAAERERIAVAKRKEEGMQKRQRKQAKKEREKVTQTGTANGSTGVSSVATSSHEKSSKAKSKGSKKQNQPSPGNAKSVAPAPVAPTSNARAPASSNADAVVKKRGWETASPVPSAASTDVAEKSRELQMSPEALYDSNTGSEELRENRSANIVDFVGYDVQQRTNQASGQSSASSSRHGEQNGVAGQGNNPFRPSSSQSPVVSPQLSGLSETVPSFSYSGTSMELPGIAMYRQEKLVEIFQRCAVARSQPQSSDPLRVVDEAAVKAAMYRWIVRAAHGSEASMDSVIPSWTDFEFLSTFFQRQFIAESRKVGSRTSGMVSMEALKEAGNAMAVLCHSHAENLMQTSSKLEEQLPPDWNDSILQLSASEVNQNGLGPMVLIDWASHAQVCIPMLTFAKLRDRYNGPPGRILTAIFAAKKRYELLSVLVSGTPMDYRLSPATKVCAEREIGVSAELWSDPFSATCRVFCGHFPDIDAAFGGLAPFAKEDGGSEMMLLGRCASVAALLPFDNTVASLYVRTIVDLAEAGDKENVPISFAAVLSEACFHDLNRSPTINDLPRLDSRLNEAHGAYVRFAEVLPPGQHMYQVSDGDGRTEVSQSGSLFAVFQNDAARGRFAFSDVSMLNIIQSMSVNTSPPIDLPIVPPIGFSNSFNSIDHGSMTPVAYQEPLATQSPLPQQPQEIVFGGVGGASIVGPSSNDSRRSGRRGRLFDLVDDGDDDNFNDADVVSGMLNNLNVDLFQSNPMQDVDVEAFSLMGIGSASHSNDQHTLGPSSSSRTTSRFAS